MNNKYTYVFLILGCVAVIMLGVLTGYVLFKPEESEVKAAEPDKVAVASPTSAPEKLPQTQPKISANTKMIYEYLYEEDKRTEVSEEEKPPYYLMDMTEDMLTELFTDWEVVDFGDDKVVMRKNMPGKSTQHYILGIQDGFVAVFYKESIDGTNLKEITDKPVSSLTLEEQANLIKGIEITGDEQLHKILEDYMS